MFTQHAELESCSVCLHHWMAANQTHWTINEAKNLNMGVITVATASSTADGGVVLLAGVPSGQV